MVAEEDASFLCPNSQRVLNSDPGGIIMLWAQLAAPTTDWLSPGAQVGRPWLEAREMTRLT